LQAVAPYDRLFQDKSLYEHIQGYKSQYKEKTVLFDPAVAASIAENIIDHSSGAASTTPIIDADGGLCLVARALRERQKQRPVVVFERDPAAFGHLQTRLLDGQGVRVDKVSVAKCPSEHIKAKNGAFMSELNECTLSYKTCWQAPQPSYTLFGTVTHGFIKYLSSQCLQSWSPEVNTSLLEFYQCRPEFFFLVSPRTMFHLTAKPEKGRHQLYSSLNVLFQILFESKVISHVPKKSFTPWRPIRHRLSKMRISQDYYDLKDSFVLMHVRPRLDIGLQSKNTFNAHEFEYFIKMLFRGNTRLIPLVEKWVPDSGFDFVKSGVQMNAQTKDIWPNEVVPLFNILLAQKYYSLSSFVTSAQLHVARSNSDY
jgi:hypothetical protein